MKLTRRQLRKLISEAFKQKVPLFDPVTQGEIDALRQKGRQDADLSSLSPSSIPKLKILDQSGVPASVNQARSLYSTLGSTEPEISVEQEQDFLDTQDKYMKDMSKYNFREAIEDIIINGNRNPKLLEQLSFVRVSDLDHSNRLNSEEYGDDPGLREHFKQLSGLLEKPIEDLVFIDNDMGYDTIYPALAFLKSLTDKGIVELKWKYSPYTEGNIQIYYVNDQSIAVLEVMGAREVLTI